MKVWVRRLLLALGIEPYERCQTSLFTLKIRQGKVFFKHSLKQDRGKKSTGWRNGYQ